MKKTRTIFLIAIFIVLLSACSNSNMEKPHITSKPCFGATPFSAQLDSDSPIVIGRVVGKSEECFELKVPEEQYGWLYHEIYVEVSVCYSGGYNTGEVLTFYELGGENERYRYTMEETPIVQVGDEVLIASAINDFMTPYVLYPINDNSVLLPGELLPKEYGGVSTMFSTDELFIVFGPPDAELTPGEPDLSVE